ncbi:MAG: hypothetical protein ACPGVU_20630, partial [Limisphaerales bacterium]
MADPLHADTRKQLNSFRGRWRSLNRIRGFCGSISVLALCLIVAALMDAFFLLAGSTRFGMTVMAYLTAFGVWWWLSGRFIIKPLTDREIARRLETRWHGLEGHVLSAVELAETKKEEHLDSPAFRKILQRETADLVRGLDMRAVLPGNVVNKWVLNFIAVGALLGILVVLPGLQFEKLLARAAVPFLGIERPSRVKIEVVSPAQDTKWLPVGDEVEIAVQLTGPRPDRVRLDVFYDDTERTGHMVGMGDGKYVGKLTAGENDVRFRIRAGDGSTQIIQMPTRKRPQIVHYEKQYNYPEYAVRAPLTIKEADGDLAALEGTKAKLRMKANQPIESGELSVFKDGATNVVQLAKVSEDEVEVELEIYDKAKFQVSLVAAETGFRNKFAPKYEIKPWPDKAPKVRMITPEGEAVVAPDERLNVTGSARDEIALDVIKQSYRVNTGEWKEVELPVNNPTNSAVARTWDLILLNLRKGDRVSTKLVAVDKRGNTAESRTVQLVVGTPPMTETRSEELKQWEQLATSMTAVEKAAGAARVSLSGDAVDKFRAGNELQRSQLASGMRTAISEVKDEIERAEVELAKTMQLASAGRESQRLGLVGEGLSQLGHGQLAPIKQRLNAVNKDTKAQEMSSLSDRANSLDFLARNLNSNFRQLLARKKSGAAAEFFDQLAQRQDEINGRAEEDAATDPNVWTRLARRQSEAVAKIAEGERLLTQLQPDAPRNYTRRLKNSQNDVGVSRSKVEELSRRRGIGTEIRRPSTELQRDIRNAEKTLRALAKESFVPAGKAEQALQRLRLTPSQQINALNRELQTINRANDGQTDVRRKATLEAASARMRDRAQLEEQKRRGDSLLASELGTASQALDQMAQQGALEAGDEESAKLTRAEAALKTIEAAHRVANLEQGLKQLARQERWEGDASNLATDRTGDWAWLTAEINAIQNVVRRSELPPGVKTHLQKMSRDAARNTVAREMLDRKNGEEPKSMADPLTALAQSATDAKLAGEPARMKAAKILEGMIGSPAQRLGQLATAAQQLAESARQVAEGADPSANAVRDLQEAQLRLSQSVAKQLERIRREGNRQNVFTEAGRENARDADDAMAMISPPAAAAQRAMRQAAASAGSGDRRNALGDAANQDEQLAKALKIVAEHESAKELGFGESATRQALREQEIALGIKDELDRRYAAAANMQRLTEGNGSLSDALAQQARNNPEVRAEMDRMSQESMAQAQGSLAEASKAQQEAEQKLRRADDSPETRAAMREQLANLADEAKDLADKAVDNMATSKPDDQNLQEAKNQLQQAAQQRPTTNEQNPQNMAQQAEQMEQRLTDAANRLNASSGGEQNSPTADIEQSLRRMAERAKELNESLSTMGTASPEEAKQSAQQAQTEARAQMERAAK